MKKAIDTTITLGNIITITGTVISFVVATWLVTARLVRLEAENEIKINLMWKKYCKDHGMNGTDKIHK